MGEKFFKINKRPEEYNKTQCHAVIRREPWKRTTYLVGGVKVIGRASWSASEPVWSNEVIYYNFLDSSLANTLNTIVVHHTNNSDSVSDNERKQKSKGYAALGYHFFIAPGGKIYEGRPIEVMGSHAGVGIKTGALNDPDWGAIGIVLQGDFHHADDWFWSNNATKKQLKSLSDLVAALKKKYVISKLLMHREVIRSGKKTVCPGDSLVPVVKSMRNKLGMKGPK
jgi:N-acetyl-anhydromuramyl-L-alanine amidase AmpD